MAITSCLLLFLISFFCSGAADSGVDVEPESTPDLDITDDVSLLQVGLRLPLELGNVPHASAHDIPEGPRSWALFQAVNEGTGVHELSNITSAAPPGEKNGDVAPMTGKNQVDSYFSPAIDENTPDFVFSCLGQGYSTTDISSWRVLKVLSPQLVPFVLPADHPQRSDVSVVIAPGGGGAYLAWESEGTDVAKALNLLGVNAFVLKYRVPAPEMWSRKAHVEDAQRAVSLVKHFAPALGLNRSRVGLFGASHGGNVAIMAGLAESRIYPRRDVVENQSPKPDFLLLNYPEIPSLALNAKAMGAYVPAMSDGVPLGSFEHLPPTFIAQGADDPCCSVEVVFAFHQLMKQFGDPPIEVNVFSGIGHAFSTCARQNGGGLESMTGEGCMWTFRARRFIRWNVEHEAPSDVEAWYNQIKPSNSHTSLISTNSSGMRKTGEASA